MKIMNKELCFYEVFVSTTILFQLGPYSSIGLSHKFVQSSVKGYSLDLP